ncbi:hypothetical protein [Cerasicoccus maritimus]|uniref:hypothetical protein n=1 Tax=Cerasicoccus maritimus TaxID=490089 RepID=UPI0028528E3C|nr:hypothetical protein [Cerasicoccus maritimus]
MADRTPKPSRRLSPEEKAARRAEQDRLAAAAQSRSRALSFFGLLVMIALIAGGAYLGYQYTQKNHEGAEAEPTVVEQGKETLNLDPKDEKLTVTQKILVPGGLVGKTKGKDQKSKDYADFLDPAYFLACDGDTTGKAYYFEISEDDYQKAFVGAKVTTAYTVNWSRLSPRDFESKTHTQ